jgi:SAM-dependent methyltransferase
VTPTVDARHRDGWAAALQTGPDAHWLVHADGRRSPLPVRRWHGPLEPAMAAVVHRCTGPTLDLGCGPGRLTAALTRAGLTAVGVDVSPHAVQLTRARGAVALRCDVFAPLPGEGHWAHVVLVDGNIGIGGDPVALLNRCRQALRPSGTAFVELEPPGPGLWRGHAHVVSCAADGSLRFGPPFRWAQLDTEAVHGAAAAAGFAVRDLFRSGRRWFGELVAAGRVVKG